MGGESTQGLAASQLQESRRRAPPGHPACCRNGRQPCKDALTGGQTGMSRPGQGLGTAMQRGPGRAAGCPSQPPRDTHQHRLSVCTDCCFFFFPSKVRRAESRVVHFCSKCTLELSILMALKVDQAADAGGTVSADAATVLNRARAPPPLSNKYNGGGLCVCLTVFGLFYKKEKSRKGCHV